MKKSASLDLMSKVVSIFLKVLLFFFNWCNASKDIGGLWLTEGTVHILSISSVLEGRKQFPGHPAPYWTFAFTAWAICWGWGEASDGGARVATSTADCCHDTCNIGLWFCLVFCSSHVRSWTPSPHSRCNRGCPGRSLLQPDPPY